jgi:esterase/lipase
MHAKYWTYRQPSEIAVTMMGLVDMLMKMDFSKFNLPMLMIVSPKDKVVNVPLAKKRFEEASSRVKEIYEVTDSVDGSSHVVAGDILSPNTTGKLSSEITRFIRALDAR